MYEQEDYSDNESYEDEEISPQNNKIEEAPSTSEFETAPNTGNVIITHFNLVDSGSLKLLLEIEEKDLIPFYSARPRFSQAQKTRLSRCIIKNVLKNDIDKKYVQNFLHVHFLNDFIFFFQDK